MDRIDKSGCQGTGNAAQRLGGVEKSHDQVFLLRSGLDGDHALEHRHADGISRINDHAQGDEDPDIGHQGRSQGRYCADGDDHCHGPADLCLCDDPDTKCRIGHKGYQAHGRLDDPVIGRGQPRFPS